MHNPNGLVRIVGGDRDEKGVFHEKIAVVVANAGIAAEMRRNSFLCGQPVVRVQELGELQGRLAR